MVKERNADIGRAVDELYRVSSDDQVRLRYEMREKAWRDEQARLDYSRRTGLEQGIKRGIRQGLQKGRQEGIQQGLQQGMERLLETAAALKKLGIPVEQIVMATKLTPEQIAGL